MTATRTDRQIFKILFKYARIAHWHNESRQPHFLADRATDDFFHNFGYDEGIDRVIEISKAVLWAMQWRKDRPLDMPQWANQRRTSFDTGLPDGGFQYHPPQLPG